jgi:hypothetical protein
MTPTSNISLLAVVTILLAPAGVVTRVLVIAVLTNRLMNKLKYQNFLIEMDLGKNELDIFYLFFGITRKILWEISPNLRSYMLKE